MTIMLKVSPKTLTIGDILAAEDGFKNTRSMVEFLARFMVDDDGAPVERSEAMQRLSDLPIAEIPGLVEQLQKGIETIQEGAVPLETSEG